MVPKASRARPDPSAHIDKLLDEALKETFPASDPVAISVEPAGPETDAALSEKDPPAKSG